MKTTLFTFLLLIVVAALAPASLFAQAVEVNPYAGYYWPGDNDQVGKFMHNQLLGVRGGGYVTKNFEIGGNFSATNHFQPKSSNEPAALAGFLGFPQGKVGASIWETEFTYNFGKRSLFGSSLRPYLVGGAGGLTTKITQTDSQSRDSLRAACAQLGADHRCLVLNTRPVVVNQNNTKRVANDILESGDTFFTFSYGGGVKWQRVWGPMGFFGDFRGRTIPNLFGEQTTWPELSAGLTFSWGER